MLKETQIYNALIDVEYKVIVEADMDYSTIRVKDRILFMNNLIKNEIHKTRQLIDLERWQTKNIKKYKLRLNDLESVVNQNLKDLFTLRNTCKCEDCGLYEVEENVCSNSRHSLFCIDSHDMHYLSKARQAEIVSKKYRKYVCSGDQFRENKISSQ